MNTNNPGWQRLLELTETSFSLDQLTPELKVKIKDTVLYSMRQSPDQDPKECIKKCAIAVYAEYYVAHHMAGYVNRGIEELDDPYTYAYDVLSHPKYSGLRIEVKTHQTDSRWVSVTTGAYGIYPGGQGINLGPFLAFPVSDIIVILKSEETSPGVIRLTPWLLSDKESFSQGTDVVLKSKFDGWYLSGRIRHDFKSAFKIFS